MSHLPLAAALLDMDGLLIDTEPVWRVAETEVFSGLGIQLTDVELLGSTGQTIDETVAAWRRRRPGDAALRDLSDAEVCDRVTDLVVAHVGGRGEPMPGAIEIIGLLGRLGLRLAIASSSPRRMIDAVCDRLGLEGIEVRCSAVDEVRGKPAPDVYLTAARRLGVDPSTCLAIEDSPSGVQAAKAAGMRCIAVPDPLLTGDPRYRQADLVVSSLTELDMPALRSLGVGRVDGQPASGSARRSYSSRSPRAGRV